MADATGSTTWAYDARGRVTQESKAITGAAGSPFVTSYTYDAMDRAATMTYPDGEVVQNSYNPATQLTEVRSTTYALNYATGLAYNSLGQVTQMTYGNGAQTRLGYWGLGGEWDSRPGSGVTNFGRLYRLRATTGSGGAPLIDLRYAYDLVGNVSLIKELPVAGSSWPTSGFTFQDDFNTKNTANWWWSSYQVVPDAPNNWVKSPGTGSNYDSHFYRAAYSLTSGTGLSVRFKVSQTDANAVLAVEANDATYRRFGVIAGSGKLYVQYNAGSGYRYPADLLASVQANTSYVLRIAVDDARGFYVEAYQESNPSVRGSYNTSMPAGKQWRFHHWIYRGTAYLDTYREFGTGAMSWSPDERMTFGYDALDRLVSAAPESGAQGYSESYQYNAIGNLTYHSAVGSYTYPASGPGSVRPHAVSSTSNGGNFGYDSNGNMLSRLLQTGGTTYTQTWDEENRLISVAGGGQTTTFSYDGDGNRVKKVAGTVTTVYVGSYFEKNLSTGVTTNYYYAGGTRVAMRQGGAVSYLHADHLGSASVATNAGGAVVANSATRYYPYGKTRSGGTGMPTDYRFTGQRLDSTLGLYQMRARWYDPQLARWLSPDSIVPNPASPQSLNRYSYMLGNPHAGRDPSGHSPEWLDWLVGAAAQYIDDVSLGMFSALAGDLDDVQSEAFQQGRVAGRVVGTVQGGAEVAQGVSTAAAGLAAGPPTLAAAAVCTAGTAGVCALPSGLVLTAEGVMALGGVLEAGHGGAMLLRAATQPIPRHHIATNKNWLRGEKWCERFKSLFDKGGLSLDDAINKVDLPGHTGPHSQAYHQWVYDRLNRAIQGIKGQENTRAALVAELKAIADELLANPGLINIGQ